MTRSTLLVAFATGLVACAPGTIVGSDALTTSDGPPARRDAGASPDVLHLGPEDAAPDHGSNDSGQTSDATDALPTDTAPSDPCASVHCATGAMCDPSLGTCVCSPGFTGDGTTCTAIVPGDPQSRTRDEMCTRWNADRMTTATRVWSGSSSMCDPGTIDPAALADGMRVLNLYRWLSGVAPASTDPSLAASLQSCALMEGLNAPPLNHFPPSTWQCYTADGASAAGSSNLAWGGSMSPAESIELYMDETGQGLGHRRWCLDSGLDSTYFGATDSATCMHSFGFGDSSHPTWVAYPNPGFAPIENFGVWSVQSTVLGVDSSGVTVTVTNMATGETLATQPVDAPYGYGGGSAIAFQPSGWSVVADTTYSVTIAGIPGGPTISYTVTPVHCS